MSKSWSRPLRWAALGGGWVVVSLGAGIASAATSPSAAAVASNRVVSDSTASVPAASSGNAGAQEQKNRARTRFAEGLVVGSMFEDRDGNGVQAPDERGLPGVRVTSGEGVRAETDRYGRFRMAGAPNSGPRGRNFILKVDVSTVPMDMTFTTPNPAMRRIGSGARMRFDFGVRRPGNSASPTAAGIPPIPPSADRPATAKDDL